MTGLRRIAPPFRRHRGERGAVGVHLDAGERDFVAGLLEEVAGMLAPEPPSPSGRPDQNDVWAAFEASVRTDPPSDPAVARLLPDGHRDDPDLAQGFRRLTEQTLRERKRTGLALAATALRRPEPLVLTREEAGALLKGLTDVRLVLAERLAIATEQDAELLHLRLRAAGGGGSGETDTEDGRWLRLAAVYEALTWWQEALVAAVR